MSSAMAIPAISTAIVDATLAASSCRDRGYAGHYVDGDIDVYLLVDPPEDPADARKALGEALCVIVMGRQWTPPRRVRIEKADYSGEQLTEWYGRMRDRVWSVRGISSTGHDVRGNRIRVSVDTSAGGEAIRRHLVDLAIPVDAVIVDVRPPARVDDPPARPMAANGLVLTVQAPEVLHRGDPTRFAVVLTNEGPNQLEVMRNAHHPVDIVVFAADGSEIWKLLKGFITLAGKIERLGPGDEVRYDVSWPLEDNDGNPAPPGRYLVRASMNMSLEGTGRYEPINLVTELQEFEIRQ
ncbi:MAG: hypothetical protein HY678_02675 [Chloroflexi bacterium]|nr:hypothetical protein [Chloroflexota bacterium]